MLDKVKEIDPAFFESQVSNCLRSNPGFSIKSITKIPGERNIIVVFSTFENKLLKALKKLDGDQHEKL